MVKRHLAIMIRERAEEYGKLIAMRYKEGDQWREISYSDLGSIIDSVSKALIDLGVERGDRVGIFSQNMPFWSIADLAILSVGAISVPIYATNTSAQAEYIASDAGLDVLFVGGREQLDRVRDFKDAHPGNIIVMDGKMDIGGIDAMFMDDLLESGRRSTSEKELSQRLDGSSEDQVATIIYTSGTTGEPKGVMLTHANFYHQIDSVDEHFVVGPKDRSLCFLPLSHVYERAWTYYVLYKGAQNNYMDDHKRILEYLSDVRPTCMVSVPRLYEKIYTTAYNRLSKASPIKRMMFNWAVRVGWSYNSTVSRNEKPGMILALQHRYADKLVLRKIRDIVGGEKNFFSSGGAPLSKEIGEFFFSAGLLICEGYGLTETSPIISFNTPGSFRFGSVGKPAPLCKVKISDEGEILAKGPNVMKGYYNLPEETEKAFVDGWFRTGDIGEFDKDGYLKITDRIKDIIITSNGKNIARQRVETTIGKDHYIEQIIAIGNGRKYISALVVPYFEALEEYAKENNIIFKSREMLIREKSVIEFYAKRIKEQSGELAHFEKVVKFKLLPKEFTEAAGEITPTLKNKRRVIMARYGNLIEEMYGDDECSPVPC